MTALDVAPGIDLTSGACTTSGDPEMWFPTTSDTSRAARAVAICQTCPVLTECREWATSQSIPFGIFGATTPADRRARDRATTTNEGAHA